MDAPNHADQMRLANLINDNSEEAELQKKLDQVVELTSSTRESAALVLHDCHYDVEKAVDMILEGNHAHVETQWRSAGKKKNKNNLSSQASKSGHSTVATRSNKSTGPTNRTHQNPVSTNINIGPSTGSSHGTYTSGDRESHQQQQHFHQTGRSGNQPNSVALQSTNNAGSNTKQDLSDSLRNIGAPSSNLITSSDPTTTSNTVAMPSKASPLQQQTQQHQSRQRGTMQIGNKQQHQRSTKIPESAVEMPNDELQISSLNVQFGEMDLKEGANAQESKGAFQDVLEPNRAGRQSGLSNSQANTIPSQDGRSNRQFSQHGVRGGGPRRPYNNDDRRYFNNSSRGGRQISNNQRPYNQRQGHANSNSNSSNNTRGVRTILNRGLQPNTLSSGNVDQASKGFPNSIDTWTNSTAEVATKSSNADQGIGVGGTLRVGQWSDVTGNEDWSEEEHWDAKVMETKVFTPSSKAVDNVVPSQKTQAAPLLQDTSVQSQINLTSKLSDVARDEVNSQPATLSSLTQPVQSQQASQKALSHMNDIFDPSVAKAVQALEQQNLAAIKPKPSMGIGQYNKDSSDPKGVLEAQNLGSVKPKANLNMNQYSKDATESIKSLVGISSSSGSKGGVPSVPPGALPLMSQPQYIMGNAYQPIFPYPYQTADVHYPVAAPATGRDQNFQSVYPPNDGNKFSRGTDGDAPSIATTQTAPVASQTHNQAFVNALPAGYQLTYMPGAFNMMPQNLYGAAPIFPHIPQPTNTGSANTVYQKNTPGSYQHHTGYSGYDTLNPLIQDYFKQHQNYSGSGIQHQQPTSKSSSAVNNDMDVTTSTSYNMYGSVNKGQSQQSKQNTGYNDPKGYQQQMSNNGQQQQFGFSHNPQQPSSISGYPLLQAHNLDNTNLNNQGNTQSQLQHSATQRTSSQINSNKYYPSWN